MNRIFVRKHINSFAIAIFLLIFVALHSYKPSFLYNKDGSLRQFGLGYRKKTILPVWLIAIILAILSYLLVLYYLVAPKIH